MGEWLKAYFEQLTELWSKLNKRAKLVISIGVAAVFVTLLFIIFWGSGSMQYQTLFSQLQPQDADAIIKKLEEDGRSYSLVDNGTTIMVPADVVHKVRLEMAGAGLPSQGVVGFEIFDESSFGRTDFERQVNFYRAVGGELSRSIQVMDGVEYARVQVSAPRESLFIEDEEPAEASVLLRLAPEFILRDSQIKAIINLVASSVQGLSPERVTLVDSSGNLYYSNFEDEEPTSSEQAQSNFDIERQFERGLRNDLRAMLSRIMGPNNYTVQVKASLNFDQRQVESKEYYPVVNDEGIIRSQQQETENYQGGVGAEGVPGTASNDPRYEIIEEGAEAGSYGSSRIITNYEINEKIERHVYAPGDVERLAVAVVVNKVMEPEEVETLENVIRAAVNYDNQRGDNITVTGLQFDDSLEQEITAAAAMAESQEKRRLYIYSGLIAFIFIILLIMFIILRKSMAPAEEEVIPGRAVDYLVGEEEDEEEDEIDISTSLSEEEKRRQKLRKTIADIITDRPEEVAQLLKSWLLEE